MTFPTPGGARSLSDRAIRVVTDPSRRVPALIGVAYVAAALGLGVSFLGGLRDPNSALGVVGIVLLFVSFGSLFYVSVTVLSLVPDE